MCWVPDIISKSRIWNRKAGASSFETLGPRKDRNQTPFRFTKSWCHLYASNLNYTAIRYVEGSRY